MLDAIAKERGCLMALSIVAKVARLLERSSGKGIKSSEIATLLNVPADKARHALSRLGRKTPAIARANNGAWEWTGIKYRKTTAPINPSNSDRIAIYTVIADSNGIRAAQIAKITGIRTKIITVVTTRLRIDGLIHFGKAGWVLAEPPDDEDFIGTSFERMACDNGNKGITPDDLAWMRIWHPSNRDIRRHENLLAGVIQRAA